MSWTAPTYSGSYAISHYQVRSVPDGRTCLIAVPALTCEITGLTNRRAYTFEVQALNGAGWGSWSAASNEVTPIGKTIVITGMRSQEDPARVLVDGRSTGLSGEMVTPWVKVSGASGYSEGSGTRTIADDGSFSWQRKASKGVSVYFTSGSARSNTVTIGAQ